MDYVATLRAEQGGFLARIADLRIADCAGSPVLVSATYLGGGLTSFAIADAGQRADLLDQKTYPGSFRHWGDPELRLLDLGGQDAVVLTGMQNGPLSWRPLLADGGLGPVKPLYGLTPLPRDLTELGQIEIDGESYLYAARRGTASFTLSRETADGGLVRVSQSQTPFAAPGASLDRMLALQLDDRPLIVAISGQGNFICSQLLDQNGDILRANYLKAENGSGFNVPNDIASVTLAGQTYLIVTSAQSSSITTVRLLPNGNLIPVDHVVDELTTRFQGATALAVVEVDGRAYVFVGGRDGGLSMFGLLPDGRLLHLETLADDAAMTLLSVSAIAAEAIDGKIVLFVASAEESGITQLVVDPGQIGQTTKGPRGIIEGGAGNDLLQAGRGTRQLIGGEGDDILVAGRDNLMIWGGAGQDVFVARPLRGRILIWDFDPAEDRLDLSQLGLVRSTLQLKLSPFSKGIRIWSGETLLEIHSADGRALAADLFTNLMFPTAHYTPPDVDTVIFGSDRSDVLAATRGGSEVYGRAGADRLLGSGVEDRLIGGSGNDTIAAGSSDDVLQGGNGDDRLKAEGGDDQISGQDGRDLLIGLAGDDLLNGNAGADRLFGGTGTDSLTGGLGDDALIGGAGDDLLQGGPGNDSLIGGSGNDRLFASTGDNLLAGGAGNDTLTAAEGIDRLNGGAGADLMLAGAGDDSMEAGSGDDRALGDLGADHIRGGDGQDSLLGGPGDDSLEGGTGVDLLLGGDGADQFIFRAAGQSPASGPDRIGDFQPGSDLIDLSALGLDFIDGQPFTGAGQVRLEVLSDHQLLEADLDGDGQPELVIRIDGTVPITADDLLL